MQRPLNARIRASVQCLLLQTLIHLSASNPNNLYVFSQVGLEVMLPCNWMSGVGVAQRSTHPYLWWETPMESIFELHGTLRFEAPKYKGRVEVGLQGFEEEGNCSLVLRELRFSDAGLYESFVRAGTRRKFVRSVELNVRDHKYSQTLAEGECLHLKLHTSQEVTVVFQGKDAASQAGIIWRRGTEAGGDWQGRLAEGERELILSEVKLADSGTYKVLDPLGLAVSTLQLTVKPEDKAVQTVSERTGERDIEGGRDARSRGFRAGRSIPIISLLLLFSAFFL